MSDIRAAYALVIVVVVVASVVTAILAPEQAPAILGLGTLITVQLLALLRGQQADAKIASVQETGEAIHSLVNSRMSAQLLLSRAQAKRIAELTNEPADIEASIQADELYRDHLGRDTARVNERSNDP